MRWKKSRCLKKGVAVIKAASGFIVFSLLIILSTPSLRADDGQWYLSSDHFGKDRDIQIACLGEVVHAVWYREKAVFWSYAAGGEAWSKPVAVFPEEGGWLKLVGDGKNLHLFFIHRPILPTSSLMVSPGVRKGSV